MAHALNSTPLTDALLHALADRDAYARRHAVASLGNALARARLRLDATALERTLDAIVQALDDSDADVRVAACGAGGAVLGVAGRGHTAPAAAPARAKLREALVSHAGDTATPAVGAAATAAVEGAGRGE